MFNDPSQTLCGKRGRFSFFSFMENKYFKLCFQKSKASNIKKKKSKKIEMTRKIL